MIFLQRGRERDRELETLMRENHQSAASCTPPTGDVPTTKVHALDQNKPGTFQSAGRRSIYCAKPVSAKHNFLNNVLKGNENLPLSN